MREELSGMSRCPRRLAEPKNSANGKFKSEQALVKEDGCGADVAVVANRMQIGNGFLLRCFLYRFVELCSWMLVSLQDEKTMLTVKRVESE